MALPPPIVEVVGPAGVGKTELCDLLAARGLAVRRTIWMVPGLTLATGTLRQVPKALAFRRETGALLWREIKHLARLDALHDDLLTSSWNGARLVVLDEGPIYTFSWLQVIGHQRFHNGCRDPWWHETLRRWVPLIAGVVVLDAPDSLLAARIRRREKPHLVKGWSDPEIAEFATRYRAATQRALADFSACGGPSPIVLQAGAEPVEELSERLLDAVAGALHGR